MKRSNAQLNFMYVCVCAASGGRVGAASGGRVGTTSGVRIGAASGVRVAGPTWIKHSEGDFDGLCTVDGG